MRFLLLPLIVTIACCTQVFAQEYSIAGIVKDGAGKEIPAAAVSLLNAKDPSWVRSDYTDDKGAFVLRGIPDGSYIVAATALTYTTAYLPVTVQGKDIEGLTLTLAAQSNALKEVTVTGKKQFIETSIGKTVINVDASATTAGNNVLELLRKSPGVTVDANGNISMHGKKGVLVLINNKETYLAADQLADYLKTLTADEVAQLELITQPSAKYDAAGNAGIINIKTKRSSKAGVSGTANATYSQGIESFTTDNVLLRYKHDKTEWAAEAGYLYGSGWQQTDRAKKFRDAQNNETGRMDGRTLSTEAFANTKLKLGVDYNISEKSAAGCSLSGNYHPNHSSDNSNAVISGNGSSDIFNRSENRNKFLRKNIAANTFFRHTFNKDSELNIDADYFTYGQHTYQTSVNTNKDAQNTPLPGDLNLDGNLPLAINVYSLKGDYTTVVKHGIKIEAGFKSSLVSTNSEATYTILQNNTAIPDTSRSNHFMYNENINAMYINASKAIDKHWQAQLGLRAENTNATGIQQVGDKEFSISNIALFPTAYISYKPNDKHRFEMNYGRRIDRPDYKSLNPFIYFADQYNYYIGNPGLQPQFSNNIELKHSYKNQLVTSLRYSGAYNVINTVLVADNATKVSYQTDKNIAKNKTVDLSVSYSKELARWWMLSVTGEVYSVEYSDDENGTTEGTGSSINIDSQFTIGKGFTAEAQYNLAGKSRESAQAVMLPMQYFGFGIAKKLLHDTATIKAYISDPFDAYRYGQEYSTGAVAAAYNSRWHQQAGTVSFTYNFGKAAENRRERNSAGADETKRIKM